MLRIQHNSSLPTNVRAIIHALCCFYAISIEPSCEKEWIRCSGCPGADELSDEHYENVLRGYIFHEQSLNIAILFEDHHPHGIGRDIRGIGTTYEMHRTHSLVLNGMHDFGRYLDDDTTAITELLN